MDSRQGGSPAWGFGRRRNNPSPKRKLNYHYEISETDSYLKSKRIPRYDSSDERIRLAQNKLQSRILTNTTNVLTSQETISFSSTTLLHATN